jgi:hypothetical protein
VLLVAVAEVLPELCITVERQYFVVAVVVAEADHMLQLAVLPEPNYHQTALLCSVLVYHQVILDLPVPVDAY